MKKPIIFLFSFFLLSFKSVSLQLPIISIYDADTIRTQITLPGALKKVSIRIRHIDTPEIGWRAKCVVEEELAKAAKSYVEELARNSQIMTIRNFTWGKYGGRIIADVYINGVDVGAALVDAGYAHLYEGGRRQGWCE